MWPFNKKKKTVAEANFPKVPLPAKRTIYSGSASSPRIHSESRRDDTADILLTGMVINSMMNDDSHCHSNHSHRHDTDSGNGFSGGGGSFDGGGSSGSWDSGSSDSGSSYDSGSSDSSSSSSD